MASPIVIGFGIAAAAMAGRYALIFSNSLKNAPKLVKYYKGGFQPEMTKREAAQILGLRESAAQDRVIQAHRKVMVANHPDQGGSTYLAAKINEAKDKMLGKSRSGTAL